MKRNLRDQVVVAWLLEHKMHMTRSIWMPFQQLEQASDWAIVWDRVWYGNNSFEPECTLFVALQDRASVGSRTLSVLDVVESLTIRFPDIYFDAMYRLAGSVDHCA